MRSRRYVLIAILGGMLVSAEAGAQTVDEPETLSRSQRLSSWIGFIDEASQRFDIPRVWIEGVIMTESAGRTILHGRPITSRAGAMGLMQLMPATYEDMRLAQGLGSDPYDPHDNIMAGTAYLRAMYDRFGYPGLFGAYNAGPTRYEASLHGGLLPAETRVYLARLTKSGPILPSGTAIFVTPTTSSDQTGTIQMPGLFVTLNPENSAEN